MILVKNPGSASAEPAVPLDRAAEPRGVGLLCVENRCLAIERRRLGLDAPVRLANG